MGNSLFNQPHEMEKQPDQEVIGLIGLGLMGTAITERLLEHGYRVAVWNRTREGAEPLLARGAEWSENPLAARRRVVFKGIRVFGEAAGMTFMSGLRASRLGVLPLLLAIRRGRFGRIV